MADELIGMSAEELAELVKDATPYEEALRAWVGYFGYARTWNSWQATTGRLRLMFPSTAPDSRARGFAAAQSEKHKATMEEFYGPLWRRTLSTPQAGRLGAGPEVVGEALVAAERAAAEEAASEAAQEAGDGRAAESAARPDPPLTAERLALFPREPERYRLTTQRSPGSVASASHRSMGSKGSRHSLPAVFQSLAGARAVESSVRAAYERGEREGGATQSGFKVILSEEGYEL